MASGNTVLDAWLEEELSKYKGVCVPVRSGTLRRLLLRKAKCSWLHPNPEDEFCNPEIGPSSRIISEYRQKFIRDNRIGGRTEDVIEPIVVERMHPEGYMILNGHHRWAAAVQLGKKWVPVEVVNITHEADIRKMLEESDHDRRVTLDLDEVVFGSAGQDPLEKELPFPANRIYKERLRLGIPALFHFLVRNGYDIWVYSAKYYSVDYIGKLFRRYHAGITGIVTGTEKRTGKDSAEKKNVEKLIANRYRSTVHIDRNMILRTFSGEKAFEDYGLSGETETWSQEIMDIIGKLDKDEQIRVSS